MKTSDIIISVIVIVSTLSPFIYLYFYSKSSYYKVFKSLKDFMNSHNFHLSAFEIWASKGIAIDTTHKVLLYCNLSNINTTFVELKNINFIDLCASKNEILIELKSKRGHSTIISIYDSLEDDPFQKGHYFEIAKKWVNNCKFLISTERNIVPPKAA